MEQVRIPYGRQWRRLLAGLVFCILPANAALSKGLPSDGPFERAVIELTHAARNHLKGHHEARTVLNGTAFFLKSGGDLFIVSARHVVEKDYDLRARVRARNRRTGALADFSLRFPRDGWIYHPNEGNRQTRYVDVAVMKIVPIPGHELVSFQYDDGAAGPPPLFASRLNVPVPVLVYGFSKNTMARTALIPAPRLAIVPATAAQCAFRVNGKKFADRKAFLIEAEISPGNSGSPVLAPVPPRLLTREMRVIGMVIGTNEEMGWAVVEPVSRIREAIRFARKQFPLPGEILRAPAPDIRSSGPSGLINAYAVTSPTHYRKTQRRLRDFPPRLR